MKKIIGKTLRIKRMTYFLILSLLFHMSLFIVSSTRKEITFGDKLIPVEILDANSIISKGDYLIKPEKKKREKGSS